MEGGEKEGLGRLRIGSRDGGKEGSREERGGKRTLQMASECAKRTRRPGGRGRSGSPARAHWADWRQESRDLRRCRLHSHPPCLLQRETTARQRVRACARSRCALQRCLLIPSLGPDHHLQVYHDHRASRTYSFESGVSTASSTANAMKAAQRGQSGSWTSILELHRLNARRATATISLASSTLLPDAPALGL
eukprot:376374-Rhodomonas_salina.1